MGLPSQSEQVLARLERIERKVDLLTLLVAELVNISQIQSFAQHEAVVKMSELNRRLFQLAQRDGITAEAPAPPPRPS